MKKQAITLVEVMIVIALIGLISGALAYNMRGSLTKGKKFKTEQGGAQICNILELARAEGEEVSEANWEEVIMESGFVKKPQRLLEDGWGGPYTVEMLPGEIRVSSENYKARYPDEDPYFN